MRGKRQTICSIGLTLYILLSLTGQKTRETNIWVGQRLTTCYTLHLTKTLDDKQAFFQSRNLLCNKQGVNEVLTKSQKVKILVTQ